MMPIVRGSKKTENDSNLKIELEKKLVEYYASDRENGFNIPLNKLKYKKGKVLGKKNTY